MRFHVEQSGKQTQRGSLTAYMGLAVGVLLLALAGAGWALKVQIRENGLLSAQLDSAAETNRQNLETIAELKREKEVIDAINEAWAAQEAARAAEMRKLRDDLKIARRGTGDTAAWLNHDPPDGVDQLLLRATADDQDRDGASRARSRLAARDAPAEVAGGG